MYFELLIITVGIKADLHIGSQFRASKYFRLSCYMNFEGREKTCKLYLDKRMEKDKSVCDLVFWNPLVAQCWILLQRFFECICSCSLSDVTDVNMFKIQLREKLPHFLHCYCL